MSYLTLDSLEIEAHGGLISWIAHQVEGDYLIKNFGSSKSWLELLRLIAAPSRGERKKAQDKLNEVKAWLEARREKELKEMRRAKRKAKHQSLSGP